eukprot:CAMPEP_0114319980 /NCGR_PEP_ID=MMETSP0059-20121206/25630_1 /TAXON_ID=36894 /ORGANISM="Pyramimonas parkeae, Strain CCMP726" /LENGTH=48 /DNA_ID= /DNA_START= /DNA_END= /DNA_ORIENTATION=
MTTIEQENNTQDSSVGVDAKTGRMSSSHHHRVEQSTNGTKQDAAAATA